MNATQSIRFDRTVGRVVYKLHELAYRASGGRVGHHAPGGLRVLLLTTKGRRTGKARTVALAYMQDGDDLVVVASNAARPEHPGWYWNLTGEPRARVRVGGRTIDVTAEIADDAQRARLWPALNDMYPNFDGYQEHTSRRIPVVILHPA